MAQWQYVRLEPDEETGGAVTTLRFDRAPMNPLDSVLQGEIREAAEQLTKDRAVRAVVVYGGEKTFAAGADVKEMAAMSYVDMVEFSTVLHASFTAVAEDPQADRRRRHRVRPRRRPRAGAVLRLPGRGRQRAARPAGDPARHRPGRGRHAAAAAADRPGEGQGPHLQRPARPR